MTTCNIVFLVGFVPSLSHAADVATEFSGYLVDEYCYGLCNAGGKALDGSNVITGPEEHTLHCLRDVPQCAQRYFLAYNAGDRNNKDYQIKFLLDDASNERAQALVNSFPKGHNRDDKGFPVTAKGKHNGDGYMKDASFEVCLAASGCDSVCSGSCDTPKLDVSIPPRFLLVAHVTCMILSWGCLLPIGVLWARNLKMSPKKPCGTPIWFQGHRTIQSIGVFLQLLGFLCILLYRKAAHFQFAHEIIGLIVIIIGTLQPVNAQLRHFGFVGHPHPDGTRPFWRKVWEFMHKNLGRLAVTLGMLNVFLGPIHANNIGYSKAFVISVAVVVGIFLFSIICSGLALELRRYISGSQKKGADAETIGKKEES